MVPTPLVQPVAIRVFGPSSDQGADVTHVHPLVTGRSIPRPRKYRGPARKERAVTMSPLDRDRLRRRRNEARDRHRRGRKETREPLPVERARQVPILDLATRLGLGVPEPRGSDEYAVTCPFHHDETPSLLLSPAKNAWYCFPCGEGGDGIELWMRVNGGDFVEAVKEMVK